MKNKYGGLKVRRHSLLPKSGQFILVWKFADQLWSMTMKVEKGVYYKYVSDEVYDEVTEEHVSDAWHEENVEWIVDEYDFIVIRR